MPDIHLSCSPDADDLFMVKALLDSEIDTGPYQFHISTQPTDSLNQLALGNGPDVIAISVAHYPAVADGYQMLPHGGSMGEGYGPIVVAKEPLSLDELATKKIAVPGLSTTAYATLRMIVDFTPVVIPITPYQRIFDAIADNEVDAGLIIHEGRLTYQDYGLHKILDLGEWWAEKQGGLPLPLGANAIKRKLGSQHIKEISALLRQSIEHALTHRDDAIQWLLSRNGPLTTRQRVSEYLDMYANDRTLDYGTDGRVAVQRFIDLAAREGLLDAVTVDFAP